MTRSVTGENVIALTHHRENILPYLVPAKDEAGKTAQRHQWMRHHEAATVADRAQALFLGADSILRNSSES